MPLTNRLDDRFAQANGVRTILCEAFLLRCFALTAFPASAAAILLVTRLAAR